MPLSHSQLLNIAASASVITAVSLVGLKFHGWSATHSVSLLASFVDSLIDVSASVINLFAVRLSLKPADTNHSFGHGKAESLAGLCQALLVLGSALFLINHAIESLSNPQPIIEFTWGVIVMAISMTMTLALIIIQRYVIHKTNSTAIRADSLHYISDLATNAVTLIAISLAYYGFHGIDPIFALVIAVFIIYGAGKIAFDAINLLMDHELPESERTAILNTILNTPNVIGVHDLRTRQTGRTKAIQMHIELDATLSLLDAHAITKVVESRLYALEPNADIIIHQDPV